MYAVNRDAGRKKRGVYGTGDEIAGMLNLFPRARRGPDLPPRWRDYGAMACSDVARCNEL